MGCDIHTFPEEKIRGKWVGHYEEIWSRDYELFGALAGVRWDCEPLIQPRGIPKDASGTVRDAFQHYGRDLHHWTWLTREEIRRIAHRLADEGRFDTALKVRWALDHLAENGRLVLSFDN